MQVGCRQGIKVEKVFVTAQQAEKIKTEGVRSLASSLPESREERVSWRLPTEWRWKLKQTKDWSCEEDSRLLVGFVEHKYNWAEMAKDEQLALGDKILVGGDDGDVKDWVRVRLKNLINVVCFRGRYGLGKDEEDFDNEYEMSEIEEYMDEDEITSLATLNERNYLLEDDMDEGEKELTFKITDVIGADASCESLAAEELDDDSRSTIMISDVFSLPCVKEDNDEGTSVKEEG